MILVIQEKDPLKDADRDVDWDVGTETQTVDGVAVQVFPHVHTHAPKTISVHPLI